MAGTSSATELLGAAFEAGFRADPPRRSAWIKLSHELGALLPGSVIGSSIQRMGELDLLLRALEQSQQGCLVNPASDDGGIMSATHQISLSELWIFSIYEVSRTLRGKKVALLSDVPGKIHHDLELVRMILAKHEIAKDGKLSEPLELERLPRRSEDEVVLYDKKDPMRTHIAPVGYSERGSVGWWAIDIAAQGTRWIERQQLSDDILRFWAA